MSHANNATIKTRIFAIVASVTGHPVDELDGEMFLDSDLGLDSIKMVELTNALLGIATDQQRACLNEGLASGDLLQIQTLDELVAVFPADDIKAAGADEDGASDANPPAAAVSPPTSGDCTAGTLLPADAAGQQTVASTVAAEAAPAVSNASPPLSRNTSDALATAIHAAVATITGHDPADLDGGMYLDSDLGLDSIKMVELAGSLAAIVPEARRAALNDELLSGGLMQIETLDALVACIVGTDADTVSPDCEPAIRAENATPSTSDVSNNSSGIPNLPSLPADSGEIALTGAQYPFLVSHWAISTCSLCSRVTLHGAFDLEIANRAYHALLARHPMLRTRVHIPAGTTSFADYRLEVLADPQPQALVVEDLSSLDAASRSAAIADTVHALLARDWPLDDQPLHELRIVRHDNACHELVFANHHLIGDGLGNQQIVGEYLELYRAAATGSPAQLPPATTVAGYRQTVQAISDWRDADADAALDAFLRKQGKGRFFWNPQARGQTGLRADTRTHDIAIDATTTRALNEACRRWRVPMNTLLAGAYLRALDDIDGTTERYIINIPTSGRSYPAVDASSVLGCFAQNLALGFDAPATGEDWPALLTRIDTQIQSAIAAGHDRAQTRQMADTICARLPLTDGRVSEPMAAMVRAGIKSNLYMPYVGQTGIAQRYADLKVSDYRAATTTNAGAIDTLIEAFHERLNITFNYDGAYFDADFIARLADAFSARLVEAASLAGAALPAAVAAHAPADAALTGMLCTMAADVIGAPVGPQAMNQDIEADLGLDSLERVRIVTRLKARMDHVDPAALLGCRTLAEMASVLTAGSAQPAAAPDDDIPYRRFVRQAALTPDAVAVFAATGETSYAELDSMSNRVAHCLRGQGVERGSLVGVMMQRGTDYLAAVLGILKAGGAYVPLDPDYPSARLAHMLAHSESPVVICQQSLNDKLDRVLGVAGCQPAIVCMDGDARAAWSRCPDSALPCVNTPDDLMVVLYTSGSTGTPKGVALAHRGYTNRLDWHQALFSTSPGERIAQKTSICFDISVWELFWPLMFGATVCPVDSTTVRNPWALAEWMTATRIAVMHFVPSLFGEFVAAIGDSEQRFDALRWLVFSGEALPVSFVRRWMTRFGENTQLANLYGPTEASIDVSAHVVPAIPTADARSIPIGKAMDNVFLLILDKDMQPLPDGQTGELWIGGIQLAQGYLRDTERTEQAFRPNGFADIPGDYLYRTGDLACRLPDGQFDYRGRIDSQIKIRGFRVELGEIEAALNAHDAVDEAAVLAVNNGEAQLRLVACVAGRELPARTMREMLAAHLPAYMIPHRFEWHACLPKNHNGKLDRKALMNLCNGTGNETPTTVAPAAFAPAPAPAPASAPASASASASASAQTSTAAPASDCVSVSAATSAGAANATGQGSRSLGPAQSWLTRYFEPPHAWAGYTRFRYRQPLDVATLDRALAICAARHPALRSVFTMTDGQWQQRFDSGPLPATDCYDGSALDSQALETQVRALIDATCQSLELDGGPLLRVLAIREADDCHQIVVAGHHMISDLLSNTLLFREVWSVYGELLADATPAITGTSGFGDYLDALEAIDAPQRAACADYWRSQLCAPDSRLALPSDDPQGSNLEQDTANVRFTVGADTLAALNKARRGVKSTLYPLLLAPLYRLLAERAGQRRVTVSHRSHGRDLGDGQRFFGAVGNFAVNYPLVVELGSDEPWQQTVTTIRDALADVPLGGVSYDLVAKDLPATCYPDNALTPVRVNFLGTRNNPASEVFEFFTADRDQRYAAPAQRRTAEIEVFLSIVDGALQVDLDFSGARYKPETMRDLGERYVAGLAELAARLQAPPVDVVGSSPSTDAKPSTPIPLRRRAADTPLSDKTAIVTGASRGIGRSIATRLAKLGVRVALVARDLERLESARATINRAGGEAICIVTDVSDLADVERMVSQVVQRFGGIDMLVNNAGITAMAALDGSSPQQWRQIVDVNLLGTYHCCRAVLPHLKNGGGGKIVNMGSDSSVIGYPLFSAYAASKHGVLGLTRSLAEEMKPHNIQVNVVCPSFVDTDMTPAALRDRAIPKDKVADVVAFLASEQSESITGQELKVFGKQDMFWFGSEKMPLVQAMSAPAATPQSKRA